MRRFDPALPADTLWGTNGGMETFFCKWRGAVALVALCGLALTLPAGAQIKRWVDERGVVHYSDAPPPPRAPAAGAVTEVEPVAPLSPADQAAAAQRLQQYRDQLAQPPQGPASGAGAAAPAAAASGPAADDHSCAAQWARYDAAYACMDPYRMIDGRIRPEAFEKCPVLVQPDCPRPGSQ